MREAAWPSRTRAYYALLILTLALMVATIDRGVLSVLVEYIKRDLHVSDTQFSVLSGFAFVFFYAFLGLPIARLADRHSRRLIIGIGIAFWSVMTALSGIAQSYQQLFWARVAVGAGESSFAPATYSILTDSFPRDRLPMARTNLTNREYYLALFDLRAFSEGMESGTPAPPREFAVNVKYNFH